MEQETSIPRTGRIEDAATQPHPQIKFTFKGQTPSTTQSSSSPVKAVPLAQDSISASTTLNNADLSKSNGSTSSLSTTPIQPVQMQENKEDVAMKDSQADEVDGKTETNGTGSSQVGITKDTNGSSEAGGEGKASAADASGRPLPPSFPPPSNSANPDSPLFSPMIKSENPSRAQSPTPRESTPALSEAPSDTPSVDSNFAGPPPETSAHDLAHPLSAYQFANTTLVPVASTSTNPFQFVSWPPQPLEDSWQRTRLPDDDEAYLAHDSEAGYSATPEEIAASKLREEARQAKIKAKLSAQVKGKGKAKETVSRPAPKARAMERVASTDATLPPKRPRPQKTPLQQEVQPEPEINRPRPIVSKTRFNRELAMGTSSVFQPLRMRALTDQESIGSSTSRRRANRYSRRYRPSQRFHRPLGSTFSLHHRGRYTSSEILCPSVFSWSKSECVQATISRRSRRSSRSLSTCHSNSNSHAGRSQPCYDKGTGGSGWNEASERNDR